MKIITALAVTLCVASLAVDVAQAEPKARLPGDASAATPALAYQSALSGFVPLKEPTASPASTWRDVNRAVASYDSMAATMDDMPSMAMPATQDMKSMPMPMPMKHDISKMKNRPMPMDAMPGMKKEMK